MKIFFTFIIFIQFLTGTANKQYEKVDFDELKEQFNEDYGKHRLIVLTSPT